MTDESDNIINFPNGPEDVLPEVMIAERTDGVKRRGRRMTLSNSLSRDESNTKGVKKRSNFQLTPEVHQKIVSVVKAGVPLNVAAVYAGIAPETLYSWLAIARGKQSHLARNREYRLLLRDIEQGVAAQEVTAVLHWRSAMPKDWHAAQKWLEVTAPERWGKKENGTSVPINGTPSININVSQQTQLTNQTGISVNQETRPLTEVLRENPEYLAPVSNILASVLPMLESGDPELGVIEGESRPIEAESDY